MSMDEDINKMPSNFVPMYRDAKTIRDLSHNMNQLIMVFNHNSTEMNQNIKIMKDTNILMKEAQITSSNDIKWIKRFVFSICGFIGLLLLGAVASTLGW